MQNRNELENAVKIGDLKKLIGLREDLKIRITGGASLLHSAAYYGHTEIIEYLVNHGLDINDRDSSDVRPLQMAVEGEHVEAFNKLIELGADLHAASSEGYQVIHTAAFHDNEEIMKCILELGVKPDTLNDLKTTPLNIASDRGRTKAMKVLLDAGADPNYRDPTFFVPLFYAVRSNKKDAVEMLLAHGADPHVLHMNGYNALHIAAMNGNESVIAPLMKAVVSFSLEIEGKMPIHIASEKGYGAVIAELVKYGVDPNSKNSEGKTPLNFALENDNSYAVSELIEAGVRLDRNTAMKLAFEGEEKFLKLALTDFPEERDETGRTFLHICALNHEKDILNSFLKKFPNAVNLPDNKGNTPLHYAIQSFLPELTVSLIEAGADPGIINNDGNTPLHLVNCDTKSSALNIMKKHASAFLIKNKKGKKPFQIAIENNNIKSLAGFAKILAKSGDETIYLNGWSSVQMAAGCGDTKSIRQLKNENKLNEKNKDGRSILWFAVSMESDLKAQGKKSCISPLSGAGIDLNSADKTGETALLFAAHKGYSHATEMLLQKGADPNLKNKKGQSALHIATECGWRYLVPDLLKYGANPDLEDNNGNTPRKLAENAGKEIQKMFEKY